MRSATAFSILRAQYGRVAYRLGVMAYRRDWLMLAELLLRQHLLATGQSDVIATRTVDGCPNSVDYASFEREFRDFLGQKRASLDAGLIAPPAFLHDGGAAADRIVLAGRRVLIVAPQYVMSSARYIENDLLDHIEESLRNLNIETETFFADGIAYGDLFKLDSRKADDDLRRLRQKVETTRPDLLLLEANFVGGSEGLSADFIADIGVNFGTKIVAVLGDAWGEYGRRAADYWAPACDLVFHFAPGGDAERKGDTRDKLLCSAFPVNEKNFYRESSYDHDISFFGSVGTYLRAFWFAVVKKAVRRLGLRSAIRTHQRTSDVPLMAEYAAIMRRSRMVINCSSRSPGVRVMTGRVWQALNAGVVLLEEDDEPTRYFFSPFVHYVPFANARQLGHMIEFFKRNADWADRIGIAAARFCADHYSAAQIWARVFEQL